MSASGRIRLLQIMCVGALSVACGEDARGGDGEGAGDGASANSDAEGSSGAPAPPSSVEVTLSETGECPAEAGTYELRWEDGQPEELIFEHQVGEDLLGAEWVSAFHNSRMYLSSGAEVEAGALTSFAPAVYLGEGASAASFQEGVPSAGGIDTAPASGGLGALTFQISSVAGQLNVDPDVTAGISSLRMIGGDVTIERLDLQGDQPVEVSFSGTAQCLAPGAGVDTTVEVSGSYDLYEVVGF